MKQKINPTRIPIEEKESYRWLENWRKSMGLLEEPARCIHVGDRESDSYELFCLAHELGTHFLVRSCVDRLSGDGKHTISVEMNQAEVAGLHRIRLREGNAASAEATLEIKYRRIKVLPSPGHTVIWRGISRLTDIQLGYELALKRCR